jgi:integrase
VEKESLAALEVEAESTQKATDGVADAGLGRDVVRHAFKHTAATWLMQLGTDRWSAADFLGITVAQLEDGYGHHHPDFQEEAASTFGGAR